MLSLLHRQLNKQEGLRKSIRKQYPLVKLKKTYIRNSFRQKCNSWQQSQLQSTTLSKYDVVHAGSHLTWKRRIHLYSGFNPYPYWWNQQGIFASTLKCIPLKKSSNPIYITFKYKYISCPTALCTQSKWCLTSQVYFQRPVPCLEVERPRHCAHIKRTFGLRCIFIPSLPPHHSTHARIHPHIQHWMDPFRGFCPAIPFILPDEG